MNGELRLEASGERALVQPLRGRHEPPDDLTVVDDDPPYESPRSAPLFAAVRDDFEQAMTEWFGDAYADLDERV